jgi:U4/U6 small nuclear ribonucleoprotein PRP4
MSSDQSPQPTGKSRVYFGSLEGQESIKRPRIEETTASSGGGIDLDALGTFFFFIIFQKKKKKN